MNRKEKKALYSRAMQLKKEDPRFFRFLKRNKLALIDFFMAGNRKLEWQKEVYENMLTTRDGITDTFKAQLEEEQLKNKVLVEENRRLKETIRRQSRQKNDLLSIMGVISNGEE